MSEVRADALTHLAVFLAAIVTWIVMLPVAFLVIGVVWPLAAAIMGIWLLFAPDEEDDDL